MAPTSMAAGTRFRPIRRRGPAHACWLKQYLPLVQDGSWAYLEITDSDLFVAPLPKDCVASAFANQHLYLVLANYSRSPQQVATTDAYVPIDAPAAQPAKQWPLPPARCGFCGVQCSLKLDKRELGSLQDGAENSRNEGKGMKGRGMKASEYEMPWAL